MLCANIGFAQKNIGTHLAGNESKGDKLFYLFSYDEALSAYQAALTKNPEEDRIELKVAETYRLLNKPEEASSYYAKVIDNEEIIAPIQKLHYAQTLSASGKYDDAKVWYNAYKQAASTDTRSDRHIERIENLSDLFKDSLTYFVDKLEINSIQADFSPAYYKDGIVFVSSREPEKGLSPVFNWNKSHFLDMYYSVEHEDGSSAKPVLFHKNINTKLHEGPTVFYEDDLKMIFTRNNLTDGEQRESSDGITKLKLYASERANEKESWSEPVELPFNGEEYSVGHPSITSDGKILYFVSDKPGGFGGTDIYRSEWKDGTWSAPENLGNEINTEGNEMFPFYHHQGVLFFSSNGHGGLGGLDVFEVKLSDDTNIVNLGYPINTQGDDFGLIMSHDGQSGYLSSNRKGGAGDDDIYHFRIQHEILDVLVYDEETGEMLYASAVQLLEGKTTTSISKTNPAGEVNFQVNPKKSYALLVSKTGYESAEILVDTDQLQLDDFLTIRIPLTRDKTPIASDGVAITPLTTPVKRFVFDGTELVAHDATAEESVSSVNAVNTVLKPIKYYHVVNPSGTFQDFAEESGELLILKENKFSNKSENTVVLPVQVPDNHKRSKIIQNELKAMGYSVAYIEINSIYYDFNKSLIRNDASAELDELINVMVDHPELKVNLSAHTDSRGSHTYNDKLAKRRVLSAKAYLEQEGISAARIVTSQHGEKKVLNGCKDSIRCEEYQHQQNRRTEIKLLFE